MALSRVVVSLLALGYPPLEPPPQKRFVGADKADKRHVVFNDRLLCAPAINFTTNSAVLDYVSDFH